MFICDVRNPAYGIGKAATDRMAHDCGIELKKHNVANVGKQCDKIDQSKTISCIIYLII